MNATQNLALYCASAVLEDLPTGDYIPPLPPAGERASNSETALTVTIEPWRKLTYINMWQLDKFDEATQQAFANSMHVPTWDLRVPDFDPKTRSIVTMSAGPQFTIPPNHLPLPEGVQGVKEWVYHLPLRTAERVMKLINRNSETWFLDINQANNQLSHLYTSCAWGPRLERSGEGVANGFSRVIPNLLFVIQSPWLLSPTDFRIFCERSMYRHYAKKDPRTGKIEATELDYVDKLWATIYDDCVRGNTHYFVLTTYNEWAFGAFSRGWTTAWVTPPKPYNAGSPTVPGPTILQSILFWMHSAQHFYFDSYRSARYHSFSEDSGLPTPISPKPSRAPTPSESDLDLASETDDNTLDKGWLNEMRTSIREIKDLKGAKEPVMSGSWVIPEIWEDMQPPKIPSKRTRAPYSVDEDYESMDQGQDGWYHKRQRPVNAQHVTTRRNPPPLVRQPPSAWEQRRARRPEQNASPPDFSSTQANSSLSSATTNQTRVLPGGFPSSQLSNDTTSWSPWFSEDSQVKIFWTRTFMSVRSTLADTFRRLLRSREQRSTSAPLPTLPPRPAVTLASSLQQETPPVEMNAARVLENRLATFNMSASLLEVEPHDENERPPPVASAPPLPQTAVALGGHTITLTRAPRPARLMSGIHLDHSVEQSWPPPRRPFMPLLVQTESASDATEIDPDAQRRPEFGFRDSTPSVHANSIYGM